MKENLLIFNSKKMICRNLILKVMGILGLYRRLKVVWGYRHLGRRRFHFFNREMGKIIGRVDRLIIIIGIEDDFSF